MYGSYINYLLSLYADNSQVKQILGQLEGRSFEKESACAQTLDLVSLLDELRPRFVAKVRIVEFFWVRSVTNFSYHRFVSTSRSP